VPETLQPHWRRGRRAGLDVVVHRPDPRSGIRRLQRDLRHVSVVHADSWGDALSDEGDELVASHDHLVGIGRRSELAVPGEHECPIGPVTSVQESEISRLQSPYRLDLPGFPRATFGLVDPRRSQRRGSLGAAEGRAAIWKIGGGVPYAPR